MLNETFTEENSEWMRPWIRSMGMMLYHLATFHDDEAALEVIPQRFHKTYLFQTSTHDHFRDLKNDLLSSPHFSSYYTILRRYLEERQIEIEGF